MKNKKSLLLTGASLALAAVLAIGGSLAYFTDRDAKTNVFTVGNVDIELTEDFEQGAELVPGVDITKAIQIENTGKNDAYVFYTYSVPTALISVEGAPSKNAIHFNPHALYWDATYNNQTYLDRYGKTEAVDISDTWHYQKLIVDDFTLDNIDYTSALYYYNGVVTPDEITNTALEKVYLDTRIDIDPEGNMYWVEKGVVKDLNWNVNEQANPMIFVNAYAIQADGLSDANKDGVINVKDALELYNGQWGSRNGKTATAVSNAADLVEAIAKGESVVLSDDITLTSFLNINTASEIVINLNGHSITRNGGTAIYVNNADAVVDIAGDGSITGLDGVYVNAGTVNLHGGIYTNTGNVTIYAYTENATVNIYGGTFSSGSAEGTDKYVLNLKDNSNANINVYGGTYVNFDPANNTSEGEGTNFVADGYLSVDNGDGTYTVVAADATASTSEELASAINEAGKSGEKTTIALAAGEYTTNLKIAGGSDIEIVGSKATVLSGQIATTASNAGTLTIKGVTINVDEKIADTTGISQTGKSAIAIWGDQTVICENVTFNMSLADSTAITSWWDTGIGTSIVVKNCTFNCNGQRPIRATGNVTVDNCTFNDPYRYAVQLTAKASTATLLDKAIINFNNNTIVDGVNGKALVYGIQLEGADYGCHDCVINGSGNTIVDGGSGSAMYYCECGIVDHDTIEWNVEVDPVHED